MKADAFDPQVVVGAVRTALPGWACAPLHEPPLVTLEDRRTIGNIIGSALPNTSWNLWITEFEKRIAARVGRKHAVAVSSGTAALHLIAVVLDWAELPVAIPALTFAGAAAALRRANAIPKFYDGDRPPNIRVCFGSISVDLLGIPATQEGAVVEDAAQALGSSINGKPCGSLGRFSILSFNNNKIVTTGGGGMVLTDNDEIAERVRFLATTAKVPSPHHYVHTEVGFNYRMAAPAAALGLVMLDKLDDTLAKKARLHESYRAAFSDVPGVTIVEAPTGTTWNHWLNAIEVPVGQRDATLTALSAAGYECRALYTPLPWLKPYKRFAEGQTFPEAERRFATTVCLPSGPELAG